MIFSFQYSVFHLSIAHEECNQLGQFTIFCMKAISEKNTLDNIVEVTDIDEDIIKKQLRFAVTRGYLTDDFDLTDKGQRIVDIYSFTIEFNTKNIEIALDHYIDDEKIKPIVNLPDENLHSESTQYKIPTMFGVYKLTKIFNKFLSKLESLQDFSKINDSISDIYYFDAVCFEKLSDFEIELNNTENKLFKHHSIPDNELISLLENKNNGSYIGIEIPTIEISKTFSDPYKKLSQKQLKNIQEKYRHFSLYCNLINGDSIEHNNNNIDNDNKRPIVLKPQIPYHRLAEHINDKQLDMTDLLLVDISTSIKEEKEIKFLDPKKCLQGG